MRYRLLFPTLKNDILYIFYKASEKKNRFAKDLANKYTKCVLRDFKNPVQFRKKLVEILCKFFALEET